MTDVKISGNRSEGIDNLITSSHIVNILSSVSSPAITRSEILFESHCIRSRSNARFTFVSNYLYDHDAGSFGEDSAYMRAAYINSTPSILILTIRATNWQYLDRSRSRLIAASSAVRAPAVARNYACTLQCAIIKARLGGTHRFRSGGPF